MSVFHIRVMIARRSSTCKFIFARVIQYILFFIWRIELMMADAPGWNVNLNMIETGINSYVNDNSEAPLIDCLPTLPNDHNFWAEFENLILRRMRASDQLSDHTDRIIKLFFDVEIVVHHPYRGTVTTQYSRNEGQRERGLRHVGLSFCHTLTLFAVVCSLYGIHELKTYMGRFWINVGEL
jgi:hypothetical protein